MFNIAIVDHRPIYHCTRSLKEADTLKSIHKVSFICVDSELENRTYEKESIYYYTIKSISFSGYLSKIIAFINYNISTYKYLTDIHPDIIHLHDLKLSFSVMLYILFNKTRLIYDAHELHYLKRDPKLIINNILNYYDYIIENIVIRMSYYCIQCSKARNEIFKKTYKINNSIYLRNIDRLYTFKDEEDTIRKDLKLNNQRIIVFLGVINVELNYDHYSVIRALRGLNVNSHYCLVGFYSDKVKEQILNFADGIQFSKNIHFIPGMPHKQLFAYISDADVSVIPIRATTKNHEFPALNKISHSFMARLPIAYSVLPSLNDSIINTPIGPLGASFRLNSLDSIQDAFERCFTEIKRKQIDKYVKQYFNWELEEKKLLNLYEKLQNQ